ncbi:hypothetical protein PQR14_24120 [Paraburkholderia bryophila]|uniref:hypothetical protein n=1 Tax=Burkholderiaceae TaxID=119060 RepID=UPI0012E0869B|nr:hypothetical protein [Burkholderia sp. 9120]
MFVKYGLIAWVTAFTSISVVASAAPPLFGSCDNDGECSAVFDRSVPEAQSLCGSKTTSIAWRKNATELLLQCTGSDTAENNRNYVVDDSNVIGLSYGRYVKISFLQQNPSAAVPDKFGSTLVCAAADIEKLHTSTFVLLDKRPGESGTSYCYGITYLAFKSGAFQLSTNKNSISASDHEHYLAHVSSQTKQRAQRLLEVFRKWQGEQPN